MVQVKRTVMKYLINSAAPGPITTNMALGVTIQNTKILVEEFPVMITITVVVASACIIQLFVSIG